ncbi:hypothetical protein V8Z79_03380 [Pantoea dispersa]|uniref:hypothetical protein n=1 Tax=Pantoea dispersa TaxID=59814 RepID=UPI0030D11ACB
MNIQDLLSSLEKLIAELKKTGKYQSALFFIDRYNSIKGNVINYDAVKELSTCRAMAQYGDFTYKEEELLNGVVNNAIAVIKSNP